MKTAGALLDAGFFLPAFVLATETAEAHGSCLTGD